MYSFRLLTTTVSLISVHKLSLSLYRVSPPSRLGRRSEEAILEIWP